MKEMRPPGRGMRVIWLGVAFIALIQSGCLLVAAGVAGGAALGYAYFKGKVCMAYNAALPDAWNATHTALAELGFPIVAENPGPSSGWIESKTGDGDRIRVDVEVMTAQAPAEGPLTRVCVRVGAFGDYGISERILHQVDAHLVPSALPPSAILGTPTAGSPLQPAITPVAGPPAAPQQSSEPPLAAGASGH